MLYVSMLKQSDAFGAHNHSHSDAISISVVMIQVFFLLILAGTVMADVLPGDAIWLGDYGDGDGTPDIGRYLPISYAIYGDEGVVIPRMILRRNENCPVLVILKGVSIDFIPKVQLRGVGDNTLPRAFPVKVCEVRLTTMAQKEAWSKNSMYFAGAKENVPITLDPKRYLLIGDTGLRSKAKDLGLGKCEDDPNLYDIHQCPVNFTKENLTKPVQGSFQGLDNWPLQSLQNLAAEQDPDVIIYVGDYIYRQSPCPASGNAECTAINGPPNFSVSNLNGTVANFLPGNWGDNMFGWWADFLYPSLALLAKAPYIAARGNHEICSRAGFGFFLFLSQERYPPNTRGGDHCTQYALPFSVPFGNEQFLVMDDSIVEPLGGGIDHFTSSNGSCPPPPANGTIVPVEQIRYGGDKQNRTEIVNQIKKFQSYFEKLEIVSQTHATNFYVAHRPMFAIACNDTSMVTLDWTMQQSLQKNTLNRISAMIGGHMHWLQALTFVNQSLPAQIVVGHGGTDLIKNNYIDQSTIPYLELQVGLDRMYQGRVETGVTDATKYGFGLMERNEDDSYFTRFLSLDMTTHKLVELDYNLTIPKGPRVVTTPTRNVELVPNRKKAEGITKKSTGPSSSNESSSSKGSSSSTTSSSSSKSGSKSWKSDNSSSDESSSSKDKGSSSSTTSSSSSKSGSKSGKSDNSSSDESSSSKDKGSSSSTTSNSSSKSGSKNGKSGKSDDSSSDESSSSKSLRRVRDLAHLRDIVAAPPPLLPVDPVPRMKRTARVE